MARVRTQPATQPATTQAEIKETARDLEVDEALNELLAPPWRPPPASPTNVKPHMGGGFDKLQTTVLDEAVDVAAEYTVLESELEIVEALTPEVVKGYLNRCERNAFRAHRLYVLAKVQLDRFKIDTEVAQGAMRDQAVAQLTEEKNKGLRTKQVTDADVRERAAALHPDEWRDRSEELARAESMVKLLERFSDVWYRRSWSLSTLAG